MACFGIMIPFEEFKTRHTEEKGPRQSQNDVKIYLAGCLVVAAPAVSVAGRAERLLFRSWRETRLAVGTPNRLPLLRAEGVRANRGCLHARWLIKAHNTIPAPQKDETCLRPTKDKNGWIINLDGQTARSSSDNCPETSRRVL
eukprot:4122535-Amphidinium_carterae.1